MLHDAEDPGALKRAGSLSHAEVRTIAVVSTAKQVGRGGSWRSGRPLVPLVPLVPLLPLLPGRHIVNNSLI